MIFCEQQSVEQTGHLGLLLFGSEQGEPSGAHLSSKRDIKGLAGFQVAGCASGLTDDVGSTAAVAQTVAKPATIAAANFNRMIASPDNTQSYHAVLRFDRLLLPRPWTPGRYNGSAG
jgi:hypothetical protein